MNNRLIFSEVYEYLGNISLKEKVIIFRDLLKYPINCKDDKFYSLKGECSEIEMKDTIEIMSNWLTIKEFEKLKDYFEHLSQK